MFDPITLVLVEVLALGGREGGGPGAVLDPRSDSGCATQAIDIIVNP